MADAIHWIPQLITNFETKPSSTAPHLRGELEQHGPCDLGRQHQVFEEAVVHRPDPPGMWSLWQNNHPKNVQKKREKNRKIGNIFYGWLWTWIPNLRDVLLNRFFGTSGTIFGGSPANTPNPAFIAQQQVHLLVAPFPKGPATFVKLILPYQKISHEMLQDHLRNHSPYWSSLIFVCCKGEIASFHKPHPMSTVALRPAISSITSFSVRRLMKFFLKPTSNATNINILCCHFQPFSIFTPHTWKPWRKLRATPRSTLNAGWTTPWTCDPWTNLVQKCSKHMFFFKPCIF